jgi:endonuclease/exonuclease/phosphatase family metal-dependent hydrolase
MLFTASKAAAARYGILLCAAIPAVAHAENIRIVTYNTQGDVSSPTPTGVLPYVATVIEGIGQQKYVGDGIQQLPDIIALQETTSNAVTVAPLVNDLNSYYGNTNYNYSSYQATTSDGTTDGGGPNALIYNQATMYLMASVGVGTPNSGTNGEFRQVVRYEFQPLVDKGTSNGIFYVYDSHAKSGSASTSDDGSTDGALRNLEAQIIRNDEATNLPANAAVLYVGDLNEDGSTEAAYQTLTAAKSPGGVSQGAGIDPVNPTNNYNLTWGSGTLNLLTEKDTALEYRDDLQLMTTPVYTDAAGTLDYVSGSLHAFGNNGTTTYDKTINSSANTSLNDIVGNGSLTPSQVFAAENANLGSDHLPVVADYTIATQPNGIWNGGTANWSNSAYWSNGVVPNSSNLEVKIDNGNATASVVTLDISVSVSDIILDANDTLNIHAGQTLTLAGPAATMFNGTVSSSGTIQAVNINVSSSAAFVLNSSGTLAETGIFTTSGSTTLNGSQNWSAGTVFNNSGGSASFGTDAGKNGSNLTVNVLAGTVVFASTQHLAGLNVSTGATAVVTGGWTGNRSVLITPNLTVAGTLNLTSDDLDVQNGNLQTITALVKQGYSNGTWAGTGIISTAAAADSTHLTALGVIQNNQSGTALFTASNPFNEMVPGTGDVLVAYTYYGDANLDGTVDGSDYSLIDNGFINNLTGWFNGDFNYDGVIDGSDYALIDNSFNQQGVQLDAALSTSQIASTEAVPEPAAMSLLMLGIGGLSRRRRMIASNR